MEQTSELIEQDYSYCIGCWLTKGWRVKDMCAAGINGAVLVVFERESPPKPSINFMQVKNSVSQSRGFDDFDKLLEHCFDIQDPSLALEVCNEAAEIYKKI
jgi:hypothetical protein